MLPDTYRPRRLWLQRMLNNAISSCCVRIERSKSLTVDQAALVSQQNPRKNTPAIYRISVMAYTDGSVVTKGRVQVTEVSTSSLTTGMEQNQNKTRDICSALRVAMACPMVNSPCCICGAVSHSHSMAYIYIRFPNSACSEKIIKHTIIQKSNFLYLPPFPQ